MMRERTAPRSWRMSCRVAGPMGRDPRTRNAMSVSAPLARQFRAGGRLVYLAPETLDHPALAPFRSRQGSLPWEDFPVEKYWQLGELASGANPSRAAFSEYHAVGSPSAAFMLAHGGYKYHHYVGYPCELFDLQDDPQELHDLAASPRHQAVREAFAQRLHAVVDPRQVDRMAKADQNALVAAHGGRAAALQLGKIGATPVPGAAAL